MDDGSINGNDYSKCSDSDDDDSSINVAADMSMSLVMWINN